MVFGVRSPKEALSSYLANALSGFLLVDPTAIETNFTGDTKVLLRNVRIRERTWYLRCDQHGRSRTMTMLGSIDELVITWVWTVVASREQNVSNEAPGPGWVNDVTLSARGFKLKIQLSYGTEGGSQGPAEIHKKRGDPKLRTDTQTIEKPVSEIPETHREQATNAIKEYIQNEVQQIIESATIRISDFKFLLELPPSYPVKESDETGKMKQTVPPQLGTTFLVGADSLQVVSLGRHIEAGLPDREVEPRESRFGAGPSGENPLFQELSMGLLYASVLVGENEKNDSSPERDAEHALIEPFDYSALVTRTSGMRFLGGLRSGLEVIGIPRENLGVGRKTGTRVILHTKTAQVRALSYLIRALFPPRPPSTDIEESPVSSCAESQTLSNPSETEISKKSVNGGLILLVSMISLSDILISILGMLVFLVTVLFFAKILQRIMFWVAGVFTVGAVILTFLYQHDGVRKRFIPVQRTHNESMSQMCKSSVFKFTFSPLSLDVEGDRRIGIPTLTVTYKMDNGNAVDIEAPHLEMASGSIDSKSASGPSISMTGIKGSVVPTVAFEIDLIEDLTIPRVVRIGMPLYSVSVRFVSGILHISTTSVQLILANAEEDDKKPSASRGILIPFPVSFMLEQLGLQKQDEDKIWYLLSGLEVNAAPKSSENGLQIALTANEIKNKLLQLQTVVMHALIHPSHGDVIEHLNVATASAVVATGYSSVDWSKMTNFFLESKVIKFPFAYIEELPVRFKAESTVLTTGESEFDIPPFVGNSRTTSKDLTNFYSQAVLGRVPDFLTNAEFMGFNVLDTTLQTAGPYIFAATPIGPIGGAAALVAYDGIRAVVNKGKEARDASPNAAYAPGDFTRGLIKPTIEPMKAGARGDFKALERYATGAGEEATNYADANKARLGGAAVGGGVMVGMSIAATPLVGIPTGIVAGAATRRAIKEIEKMHEDQTEKIGNPSP